MTQTKQAIPIQQPDPQVNEKAWKAWVARNRKEDAATTRVIKIWAAAVFGFVAVCAAGYGWYWSS